MYKLFQHKIQCELQADRRAQRPAALARRARRRNDEAQVFGGVHQARCRVP